MSMNRVNEYDWDESCKCSMNRMNRENEHKWNDWYKCQHVCLLVCLSVCVNDP
jgi:hypothetical protein